MAAVFVRSTFSPIVRMPASSRAATTAEVTIFAATAACAQQSNLLQEHALHLAPFAIAIAAFSGIQLVKLEIEITGLLRQSDQQLSREPTIARDPPVAVVKHPFVQIGQRVE